MGVHIHIVDARYFAFGRVCDIKEWDWLRHAGDNAVFSVLAKTSYQVLHEDAEDYDERVFRPDDIEEFRRLLHAQIPENHWRWDMMCDLLAADASRALYFSW
jgi:hypothetical protein